MHPLFPKPLPDETIFSLVCRFHLLSAQASFKGQTLPLLGINGSRPSNEFPSFLPNLAKVSGINLEYLIKRMTSLHYYEPFIEKCDYEVLYEALRTGNTGNLQSKLGMVANRITPGQYLKYCPLCSDYDENKFGVAYWHKVHQLVGLTVCPIHQCHLVEVKRKSVAKKNPLLSIQASVSNPLEKIETQLGDCIDCKMCIKVCPTGIDIRNGTQLECVNCTACIDACDEIMEKIDRPLGLIRYDSEKGIKERKQKIFTTRVLAYSAVLVALLVLQGFLLANRNDVDVLLLKTPGTLYQEVDESTLSNLYNYQIINKTSKIFPIEFRLKNKNGKIKTVGPIPMTVKNGVTKGVVFIELPKDQLKGHSTEFKVEVLSKGIMIDELTTNFLGPE